MLIENQQLMTNARETLRGRWGDAIAACIVFAAIIIILNAVPLIGSIASLLISGPMILGFYLFFLPYVKGETPRIAVIFDGFKSFLDSFVAYLVALIFIFLWSLLLIVPGIIAAISYSMMFLIMAENPGMDGMSSIRKSKEMMNGYKWKYFCLMCRFIGWFLLCIITCGIAGIWVGPYWVTSKVLFYEDIKKEKALLITAPSSQTEPLMPS
ncbi:MAG TPA: DUF975 family protein [Desulfomonilia bacterium]